MNMPWLAALGVFTLTLTLGAPAASALDDAPVPPPSSVADRDLDPIDDMPGFRRLPAPDPWEGTRTLPEGRWSLPMTSAADEPPWPAPRPVEGPASLQPDLLPGLEPVEPAPALANQAPQPPADPLPAGPALAADAAANVVANVAEGPAVYAPAPPAPQPWHLPQPRLFQDYGIALGGWLEQGYTYNAWRPLDRFNGPVATNDRAGEYQLNQLWLFIDRPTNTGGHGFDLGGHIDLCYGTDWRFGKNWGLEDRINGANQFYGLVMPQFYLETAVNDFKVRMGHYATGFGYEVVPAPGNFFYSHSYSMAYSEPLLVTGVQADYQLNEQWVVTAGFNRGWMTFEDWSDTYDFLGGVRWNSCDKTSSFSFLTTVGTNDPQGLHQRFAYALVYKEQVTDRLQYVLQHNLGVEDGGNLRDGSTAQWFSVANWLVYTINPHWSAGLRAEWFRDEDGTRVAGVGNWIGSNRGWGALPGFAGDFYELTAGVNWRPRPNLVFRPEVRYDWYNGTTNLNNPGVMPFNSGLGVDQLTVAADLIITF